MKESVYVVTFMTLIVHFTFTKKWGCIWCKCVGYDNTIQEMQRVLLKSMCDGFTPYDTARRRIFEKYSARRRIAAKSVTIRPK